MTEDTEGDAIGTRPWTGLRAGASVAGLIASLSLFVSSVIGFAGVDESFDAMAPERRVLNDTTVVVASNEEACLAAASPTPHRTGLGA